MAQKEPSFLTRFWVKNYKCLADVAIPLTPIHVVIGQNDTGKTSLLEAMLAFSRSSGAPFERAFPGKWVGTDLVFEGAAEPEIEFNGAFQKVHDQTATLEYGFSTRFLSDRTVQWRSEWFRKETTTQVQIPQHISVGTSVYYRNNSADGWRAQLNDIADHLGPAHLYRFDPSLMALPASIDPRRKFRMDPDGFGLASLLDDILGYQAELFIKLRKRFCEFFPQFRSVRLEVEEAAHREYNEAGISHIGQRSGKGIYFETQGGRSIRAQQASDGAILFLGFLALLHLPEPPRLLLIEEPEKGIYPKRLDEIVCLLKEIVAPSSDAFYPQVVLSTHSPYLLSLFEPEEVTVMSRKNGRVRARPLRDAPNIRERLAGGEFYLGELWYNLTEEELFDDAPDGPANVTAAQVV